MIKLLKPIYFRRKINFKGIDPLFKFHNICLFHTGRNLNMEHYQPYVAYQINGVPEVQDFIELRAWLELLEEDKIFKSVKVEGFSSFSESFPWLLTEEGNYLDWNHQLSNLEGLRLFSRYLETRLGIPKAQQDYDKLIELINPFINQGNITTQEFILWIQNLCKEKNLKDFLLDLNKEICSIDLSATSEILSECTNINEDLTIPGNLIIFFDKYEKMT